VSQHLSHNQPPPATIASDEESVDFSREEAAYAKEQERLVRDHLGQIALVHGDEVVGVFRTADEAIVAGMCRFGCVPLMVREIRDPKQPLDFISLVDFNDPSFKRID
jgi:hypothetical protein